MIELTGTPADPDCLHCVLQPLIDQFMRERPLKPSIEIVGELAQILGELIASGCYNTRKEQDVPRLVTFARHQIQGKADDLLRELRRNPPARTGRQQ